jgi:hypothetical protein
LWRWWYFGYFLPNTFYAKVLLGQNLINTAFTIRMSVAYFSWLVKITFPYFLAWGLFLINADKKLRRRFLILLIPVLVCPLLYFFFQQFQNIAHRYQIAILPSSLFLLAFSLHHLEKLASGSLIVNGGLFGLAIFCSFIWFPKTLTSKENNFGGHRNTLVI